MRDPMPALSARRFPSVRRAALRTLQVNVGYRCNQSCLHCHVSAGPKRKEVMGEDTLHSVLAFMDAVPLATLDITGGAPELNPGFRRLVEAGRRHGLEVIDRCNLTILSEPGHEDLAEFLAEQRVRIVASLPCYTLDNVDAQRGDGVFERSIDGLRKLNALGFGIEGSGLGLDLVYNPLGPSLPPPQAALQADYQRELDAHFGIRFNSLLTLANVPVGRFGSTLVSKGDMEPYLDLLEASHQDTNLDGLMCRTHLSVDWRGYVYDCDFNQMLDLPLRAGGRARTHLDDLLREAAPAKALDQQVVTRGHCFACTAGQGSSCGGALA